MAKQLFKSKHDPLYKTFPKYLGKKWEANRYLGYQQTSADYRLFEYDITTAFLEYVKMHADKAGRPTNGFLNDHKINPAYYGRIKNGYKLCSFRYCMFVVSKIGEPITLIV